MFYLAKYKVSNRDQIPHKVDNFLHWLTEAMLLEGYFTTVYMNNIRFGNKDALLRKKE